MVFLSAYNKVPLLCYLEKEYLITIKKNDVIKVPKPTWMSWFKNGTKITKEATFIHLDPGNTKADKPQENEARKVKVRDGIL